MQKIIEIDKSLVAVRERERERESYTLKKVCGFSSTN